MKPIMHQGVTDYILNGSFKNAAKKTRSNSKKAKKALIQKNDFFVDDVINSLKRFPGLLLDKDDLVDYAKKYLLNLIDKPVKIKAPRAEVNDILYNRKVRQAIELFTMHGLNVSDIYKGLKSRGMINEDVSEKVISDYLFYYWNYREMEDLHRNIFFSKVLKNEFYLYHRHLYFKTASFEMIADMLGFNLYKDDIAEHLKRDIRAIEIRLRERILERDIKSANAIAGTIRSLSESFNKLGGAQAEEAVGFADYLETTYANYNNKMTREEMERANEENAKRQEVSNAVTSFE